MLLRQNSDLFYLTGIEQEESILLLYPDAHEEKHARNIVPARAQRRCWKPGRATS